MKLDVRGLGRGISMGASGPTAFIRDFDPDVLTPTRLGRTLLSFAQGPVLEMLQAFTRSSQTALRCIRPALTCTRAASSKSPNALLSNLDLGTGAPKRATDPSGSPVHWDRLGNVVSGAAKTPDQLWADMDSAPRMPPPTAWAGPSTISSLPHSRTMSLYCTQAVASLLPQALLDSAFSSYSGYSVTTM